MKLLCLFISLLLNLSCSSTPESLTQLPVNDSMSFINNDSISCKIVLRTCDTCIPISNIGFRVSIDLTESQIEILNTISKEKWLFLLSQENSDWAANIILYFIKNRDATLLVNRDTRQLWIKNQKKADLNYWQLNL